MTWATALTSSGGSLTKAGLGTLTLNPVESYSGPTVISGGTLQLGTGSGLTPQLAYTFATGSAINYGNNASTVTTSLVGNSSNAYVSASGGPRAGLGTLNLNGDANSYLNISAASLPNLSGSSAYTIAMWIKTTTQGNAYLYKGDGGWISGDEHSS